MELIVAGNGRVPVTRHQGASLRTMARAAITAALADAGGLKPDLLVVGNMLSAHLSCQQQLGALLAGDAALGPIEALTVETACSSGAMAFRTAVYALLSGEAEVAVVCGVEEMTHRSTPEVTKGLAMASDWESEGAKGETFVSLNAALMRAYLERFDVPREAFAPFPIIAHQHGLLNPDAGLRKAIDLDAYRTSPPLTAPLRLLDASLICDGAAAVVLTTERVAMDRGLPARARTRVLACASAVDPVPLAARSDLLALDAVARSTARALQRAQLTHAEIDLFEVHDAYSIMAVACLEAAGFAEQGQGTTWGREDHIGLSGKLPLFTFGGLKSRGHPVGASGVYQIAEAQQQLRGEAGANQVPGARVAMTQSVGGAGSTVVTTILAGPG